MALILPYIYSSHSISLASLIHFMSLWIYNLTNPFKYTYKVINGPGEVQMEVTVRILILRVIRPGKYHLL